MWKAEVTRRKRCVGRGCTSAAVKRAFSSVLRDASSSVIRDGATPSSTKSFCAAWASVEDRVSNEPFPPEKITRASRIALGQNRRLHDALALAEDSLARAPALVAPATRRRAR